MCNLYSVTIGQTQLLSRLTALIALVGGICVLASPTRAQESPSLDPAGIRGVRYMLRDDARTAAITAGADTLLDWYATGLAHPSETVTPAQIRTAFEGNVIRAERRFAQFFIISGALHSVARRADRQIVVQFVEGGLADNQRRALTALGARAGQSDPAQVLGGLTGGRMHAGATAVLPPEHEDAVAGWEPGVKVTLHCRGASNVPLAVLLDNCVPQVAVIAEADRLADAQSDLVLARKPLTVPPTPKRDSSLNPTQRSMELLVTSYALGLVARDCPNAELSEWMRCSNRILDRGQPLGREKAVWRQVARDLVIPELASPGSETPTPPRQTNPATRK